MKTYDVVIPLLDRPSEYADMELMYCLRSIEAFFPVRDVWVITGNPRPEFSVNYIIERDKYPIKYENTRQKILRACECSAISNPFMMMNDDMILTAPMSDLPPLYYCGTIEDYAPKTGGAYRDLLNRSAKASKDGLNYAVHTPLPVDKRTWAKRTSLAHGSRNVYGSYAPFDRVELPRDVKTRTEAEASNIREFIDAFPFVSLNTFSLTPKVQRELDRLLPNPSRWE